MLLKRRKFLAGVTAMAAMPVAGLHAQEAQPLPDMVLGDPAAPIEIIEYSSMTCPHCATFHTGVLPELKKQYLDTGRARLVFREFPLDRLALHVSVIARCLGEHRFFPFVDTMFAIQDRWIRADDPVAEIRQVARMGGLDPDMIDACLEDGSLVDGVLAVRLAGQNLYDVDSTPFFVINGESHSGNMSFEQFDSLLRDIEAASG